MACNCMPKVFNEVEHEHLDLLVADLLGLGFVSEKEVRRENALWGN